jgi:AraC family transcriptional regulator, transcriptional activator of pobA
MKVIMKKKAIPISAKKAERLVQAMTFLAEELKSTVCNFSKIHIRKGLIDIISGMITEEYTTISQLQKKENSRFAIITAKFKELLLNNFRKMKKPTDYASALNLSTPYLNQIIKASTGFTVSYWIQKMVVNEAKVLLSSTDKTIKDISYELGYQDQAYFSRLFSRNQKLSPQAFRALTQGDYRQDEQNGEFAQDT